MEIGLGLLQRLAEGVSSRYRVERELGRGGMATVFLARDIAHDRPVAIKVLHADVAAGFSTERFLREIRLLAALQHPNILPLYDSGAFEGIPYFVMPFIAGESLRDRLDRDKTVPVPLALRMASEAAGALDYAHRQGVVHRDIKPENILLSDDHVIIADFGIARAAAQSGDQKLTATAMVIGTPAYMSPEQASGDTQISGRSDIYSLACVLFEAIGGRPPFRGDNAAAMIGSRFAAPAPRLSTVKPGIPEAVDNAIAAALSFLPEDRPESAAEFSAMLFNTPASPIRTRFRWSRTAIGSVTVLAVAAMVWLIRGRSQDAADASARTPAVTNPAIRHASHIPNPAAHDFYVRGRASLETPSAEGVKKATELFSAALSRDSLYAEAWAGLADCHTTNGVGNYVAVPPRPEFDQARFAAEHALTLDSTLAEAHASLAIVQMMYDFDWEAAARSLDKAQAFDPGYETTYLYRSFLLSWLGKFESANAVSRQALHMDPKALRFRQDIGRTLIQAHRFAEAERELRADIAIDPRNARIKMLLGEALIADGKASEASKELDDAQNLSPGGTRIAAFRVAAYASEGRRNDAQRVVDSLTAASDRTFVPEMDMAIAWAGLGDYARALASLEKAYDDRTLRPFLRDPVFDPLKSNSGYKGLLAKLRLPP